jgi:hypothetical protein
VRGVVPTADPFIGRGPPAASLQRAIDASVGGHGSLVLVAGEAGIGKTRLVEEAAAQARSGGHLVVWGSCWDGDGVPAFWPWTEALQPVVALWRSQRSRRSRWRAPPSRSGAGGDRLGGFVDGRRSLLAAEGDRAQTAPAGAFGTGALDGAR